MGGIKHSRWSMNPAEPRVSRPDQNSEDANAWAQWAAHDVAVSCRVCGQGITLDGSGSMGMMTDGGMNPESTASLQWKEEIDAGMHKDCFMKYMMIRQARENGSNS